MAIGAIVVQLSQRQSRENACSTNAAGPARTFFYRIILGHDDVVLFQCLRQRQPSTFSHHGSVTRAIQLAENTDNTTSTVNIFHRVFWVLGATFTAAVLCGRAYRYHHGEVDFTSCAAAR